MDKMVAAAKSAKTWGPARWYCLLTGAFLLVRAVSTLAGGASFDRPGDGWRSIFQLAAFAVLCAGLATGRATWAAATVGVVYAVATALELLNGHEILASIPVDMRDRWVHPLLAVIALACVVAAWQRMHERAH
jgi:hypothetical protein